MRTQINGVRGAEQGEAEQILNLSENRKEQFVLLQSKLDLVELAVLLSQVLQEDGGFQRFSGGSQHELVSAGIQGSFAVYLLC